MDKESLQVIIALFTIITGFRQACDTIQVDFQPVDTKIPLSATSSMSQRLIVKKLKLANSIGSESRKVIQIILRQQPPRNTTPSSSSRSGQSSRLRTPLEPESFPSERNGEGEGAVGEDMGEAGQGEEGGEREGEDVGEVGQGGREGGRSERKRWDRERREERERWEEERQRWAEWYLLEVIITISTKCCICFKVSKLSSSEDTYKRP
ncbi:hypothetical protein NA56DRAFT_700682 [Hyaloscypha hepaticicola]|uniref:Uncharacterized protein n=1 Tax=Hyaloscypha hepaticicola TaxID=2082293 RepID=A0A2J6QD84_9HELO|nr:hypothetical protein NA56DRAFT_700682 [Hyaloscypha hepaticicola]